MTIVNLEDILTKDEVGKLAEKVSAALAKDKTAVLVGGGEILATVMGPEAIRDAVHQRVLRLSSLEKIAKMAVYGKLPRDFAMQHKHYEESEA